MNSQLQLSLLFEKRKKSNGGGRTPQKFTAVVEGKSEKKIKCSVVHSTQNC